MKSRTKGFLKALAAAGVLLLLAIVAQNGSGALIKLIIIFGAGYIIYRGLILFGILVRPVAEKVEPSVVKLENHIDGSLREAGLGKIADLNRASGKTIGAIFDK